MKSPKLFVLPMCVHVCVCTEGQASGRSAGAQRPVCPRVFAVHRFLHCMQTIQTFAFPTMPWVFAFQGLITEIGLEGSKHQPRAYLDGAQRLGKCQTTGKAAPSASCTKTRSEKYIPRTNLFVMHGLCLVLGKGKNDEKGCQVFRLSRPKGSNSRNAATAAPAAPLFTLLKLIFTVRANSLTQQTHTERLQYYHHLFTKSAQPSVCAKRNDIRGCFSWSQGLNSLF